ncbi:hypothetical protein [Rhizobium wuzhouense]|uniref:DUF695 domain-containing protein n=1 Tax=Rhizobium wuzhouense TaxID=1986026 RepID=A0ABX5NSM5_9HYPH|nr:hypothetical protein [Rhizobium wuzhouense]PYB71296.1 hypothetical protein DMY87_18235 [Rhizobium wuzhouense]
MAGHTEFRWYASADAEAYTIKARTREAVIAAATAERMGEELSEDGTPRLFFYIVEASKFDLRIADYAIPHDVEDLFENIEDSASGWDFGNPDSDEIFVCAEALKKDLHARIRAACEEWQKAHDLAWESWAFAISRNEETIVVPLDETGGAA